MFAGAVRETVYSRPDVIKRVNAEFVPVALKAALINNPPNGLEGAFLAEVGRTKAAPQGIVAANAAGKVLVWALSFDGSDEIPKFLDYIHERNLLYPDASAPVTTKRFMRFPSQPMADVADFGAAWPVVKPHAGGADYCPGVPPKPRDTFVATVVGRRIAPDGTLQGDCAKQENYIEDVFDVPVALQRRVAQALDGRDAGRLPDEFARMIATYCYLGMLDVRPVAPPVPGHTATEKTMELTATARGAGEGGTRRYWVTGTTDVGSRSPGRGGDGASYSHTIALRWQGWLTLQGERITGCTLVGEGREQLSWGSPMFKAMAGKDPATHLMAGRPLSIDSPVRYGVTGAPVAAELAWQGEGPIPSLGRRPGQPGPDDAGRGPQGDGADVARKMQQLQRAIMRLIRSGRAARARQLLDKWLREAGAGAAGDDGEAGAEGRSQPPESLRGKMGRFERAVRRWEREGRSLADVQLQMQRFQGFAQAGDWAKAEAVLDEVLKVVEAGD